MIADLFAVNLLRYSQRSSSPQPFMAIPDTLKAESHMASRAMILSYDGTVKSKPQRRQYVLPPIDHSTGDSSDGTGHDVRDDSEASGSTGRIETIPQSNEPLGSTGDPDDLISRVCLEGVQGNCSRGSTVLNPNGTASSAHQHEANLDARYKAMPVPREIPRGKAAVNHNNKTLPSKNPANTAATLAGQVIPNGMCIITACLVTHQQAWPLGIYLRSFMSCPVPLIRVLSIFMMLHAD